MSTSKKQVLLISGMGVFGKVANYSALPDPTLHDGETWIALASQGSSFWPGSLGGTWYDKGQYYSDGTQWIYDTTPYQASQSDVNTGTIGDQFVSPSTLANSNWAFTASKVLATVLTGLSVASGGAITAADTILQALGKVQYQINNLPNIYRSLLDVFATTITSLPDTITLAQANSWLRVNVAVNGNLTIPPNSSVPIPIGSYYYIRQIGVGAITLVPGSGVTLNAPSGVLSTGSQYDVIRIIKQATDSWMVEVGAASWHNAITSPSLSTKLSKSRSIQFSHSALNPADSTTYYFGSNIGSNTANTTSTALRRNYAPLTGFLYAGNINVQVSSTLGSPEAVTVTLNNKTQGTSVVLSSSVVYSVISNGFSFELGSPFAINANDSLEIKIDTPVFATNPISVINLVTLYCGTKS